MLEPSGSASDDGSGSPFDFSFGLPTVAETWDGGLNDINGYHPARAKRRAPAAKA